MRRVFLLLPLTLMACAPSGQETMGKIRGAPPSLILNADLLAANGARLGGVTLTQEPEGTRVVASISGVSPGVYAMHLHAVGKCEAPGFTSAGPHFNPEMKQHGADNPAGAHQGDLPNITVGADGRGGLDAMRPGLQMLAGAAPLLDADGAAVVLHAGPDDYRSDPAGNAGARIGCATLTKPGA